jgi:conjugative transfer signal peptidase TraF
LPDAVAAFGKARGYLHTGECPNHTTPVVKRVVAMAGDVVETHQHVKINGTMLPRSTVLAVDSHGRPLPRLAGERRLQRDELWLFSGTHAHSWDSRYFGPVLIANVQTVAQPVWTIGGEE